MPHVTENISNNQASNLTRRRTQPTPPFDTNSYVQEGITKKGLYKGMLKFRTNALSPFGFVWDGVVLGEVKPQNSSSPSFPLHFQVFYVHQLVAMVGQSGKILCSPSTHFDEIVYQKRTKLCYMSVILH